MSRMPDRNYHVRPVLADETLAAALRLLIRDLSWNDARRLIATRRVNVNGNLVVDDARRLRAGDVVKVFEHPQAAIPTAKDVAVRYADEHLIVVEKPAGVTTLRHAEERDWDDRRKQRQATLDELVQELVPAALAAARRAGPPADAGGRPRDGDRGPAAAGAPFGVLRRTGGRAVAPPGPGTGPHRSDRRRDPRNPGPPPVPTVRPVHRLDRDTSGLMLFALSPEAERSLVGMFKAHTVSRSYVAVVHGRVAGPMRIESWIARDRGDGHRGSTPSGREEPGSQRAVTHVRPDRPIGEKYTVVRCQLETGRTHQIRIHLAEAGHMLCGERTYVRPRPGEQVVADDSGAPRQALHSAELEFVHPVTGQALKFTAPLPKDLAQWLARLGRGNGA
jgi:23S rRNA pseudouridine1911/1915/1917 synthase